MTEIEAPPEALQNQGARIVVVCMHGRSRSQFVARRILARGYTCVATIGINNPDRSKEETREQIAQADVVVATGADIAAEIIYHLQKIPLVIPLTGEEHATLNASKNTPERIIQKIDTSLTEAGFGNFAENQALQP